MSQQLPRLASETTPENPWPLRVLSEKLGGYIAKAPAAWVSGQIVQYTHRPRAGVQFLTLRDNDQNVSMTVKVWSNVLAANPCKEGDRVTVHGKADFYPANGSLSLQASAIKQVGLGQLLAQIEALKAALRSEGLFAVEHKKPLPFLPRKIGLICGRNSKAEDDVVQNASLRWPGIAFEIREVAVQGVNCVPEVTRAIQELDADPGVDVIVVARGGGAVEDLLPFSNETLVRAAFNCTTPLVSAIGHETDSPLLDLVADYRASTPTDAASRIVPSLADETNGLANALQRARTAIGGRLKAETQWLASIRAHPLIANPHRMLTGQNDALQVTLRRARLALKNRLNMEGGHLEGTVKALRALSPQATLDRGYAIATTAAGKVIDDAAQAPVGTEIQLILARGAITATSGGHTQKDPRNHSREQ